MLRAISPSASTCLRFFFFQDPATTPIYTLSLHDALPISCRIVCSASVDLSTPAHQQHTHHTHQLGCTHYRSMHPACQCRSEEHTSELQSRRDLVCRLLLEKKKTDLKTESLCLYLIDSFTI